MDKNIPTFFSSFSNDEIDTVLKSGSIDSTFDQYSNILLTSNKTSISASLMSIPLINDIFSVEKVQTIYDVNFSELINENNINLDVVDSQDYKDLYLSELERSTKLQKELDAVVRAFDSSSAEAIKTQSFSIITALRIKMGEGKNAEDFSTVFPFKPLVSQ